MRAIYVKELRSYFNTLPAYVFIAIFLLGGGAAFATSNIGAETASMAAVFGSLHYVLFLTIPMLTMRFAGGPDRTLLSAPVSTGAIMAGRYFAALTVLLAALASSFIYPIILALLCEPAWGEIASGFLGLLLLGAALLPVGMLVAPFVKKRGAAGALTLCVLLLILLAQAVIPGMSPWLKNILIKATPTYHMNAFISGVVGISDIVYFASVSALLLYLSVRVTNFNKRYR